MLRRVVALLALPMAGLLAQTPVQAVRVTITSVDNAEFRLVGSATDSSRKPIVGRGRAIVEVFLSAREAYAVAAVDSVSRIRIEASENGRLIGTAEGPYVGVLRDSTGRVMVAARASIPREPFSFFPRRPTDSRP
jgi:hypothetical protein